MSEEEIIVGKNLLKDAIYTFTEDNGIGCSPYKPMIGITEEQYKEYMELKERIKQLEKENERLKLENNALQNTKDTCPFMATSGIRCENKKEEYISKSLIKEKIEELEKVIDFDCDRMIEALEKRDENSFDMYNKWSNNSSSKIELLKELLGEEK